VGGKVQKIGGIEGTFAVAVVKVGEDLEKEVEGVTDDDAEDHALEVRSVQ
jgi:hypothetical protein